MNRKVLISALAALLLGLVSLLALTPMQRDDHVGQAAHAQTAGEHEGGHGEGGQGEGGHDEGHAQARAEIDPATARKAGIETAVAGPGTLRETATLYGKTAADHASISHLRARFPGPIIEVNAVLGDSVKKGQQLAVIESNDSLQTYPLRAPIAGQVIDKQASRGEYSGDRVLFTIANYDQLWAELQLFPKNRALVARGQKVVIHVGAHTVESTIGNISPGTDGQPFAVARAAIDNPEQRWTTDLMVQGEVVVNERRLSLVVENRALQPLRGDRVVFVRDGDHFTARPLQLGRSDGRVTEVLGGLKAGERYVTANSYVIKADIEKSGASHHH
ncbi:efflux RND transporter periplasmic adaptor subunit [Microbulbifer sp. SAOS-129_SWC]|uniref:efflux RND transporter periplasmic adaptor subunit n=1 Tax=Microbulbifer sp. SAOS-129_SWC TaxID=3145235 RepID=UPI0032174CD0